VTASSCVTMVRLVKACSAGGSGRESQPPSLTRSGGRRIVVRMRGATRFLRVLAVTSAVAASGAWLACGPLTTSPASAARAASPLSGVSCTTTKAITYGPNSLKGAIASAGADACFTFTTAPGDVVWLNMATTSGSLSLFYDFFRPGPVSACASPYGGATSCPVPSGGSGVWTLQISDSSGTHTGAFRLSIQRLDVGVGCETIKFGKAATTDIASKASSACFTFTGASGDYVYASSIGTSGTIGTPSAVEASPAGSEQCLSNGTIECSLTSGGTQTLLLYSESGRATGAFRTYLQRMTAPKRCTAVTVGGGTQSGSVAAPGDVACFTFAGTAGKTDTATITDLSGTLSPEIDFFRPTGTSACASPGLSVSCDLDTTGNWTVLVYDAPGPGTGTFSFAVTKT
jgi:hypothetical protein